MTDAVLNLDSPFRLIVENIVDYAIFTLDTQGHVTSWNAGAERIKKYRPEEIIGQHFSIFYPPEDIAAGKLERELAVARETGRFEDEGWRLRRDGSRFWANVIITALRDTHGVLHGFVKTTRDLTERRQEEIEARRGREIFRRIVEAAPNAMVMIDNAGKIVMVNAQAENVFGYDRRELLEKSIEMLVPLRFRGHHPNLREAFFGSPQSRPMGAGRDLFALRKDGSEFPVEIGLNPIEMEDETLILSSIIDITPRKRQQELFRRVVEAAPSAMVMINAAGIIDMVNNQAERVFGYNRYELLGQQIEMLVPARFQSKHPNLRGHFFGDPLSRPMGAGRDLYALRKDGSEFPVEIGLNPIETDGGTMVLSAIVDISDRKHKEASIEAALAEKNILLAEIHHRVKNNLQIIHSLLDLQAGRLSDQVAVNALKESQSRIRSMALIHQVLYQSKDFAGVDFRTVLQTLVSSLIQSYRVSQSWIEVDLEADQVFLPLNVAIPCGLVINELTTNTIKHAFPDGRPGKFRIHLKQGSDSEVTLLIEDNGVGIPETLDLEATDTLGLQLVQLLVNQIHGKLEIHRAAPTSFCVTFKGNNGAAPPAA